MHMSTRHLQVPVPLCDHQPHQPFPLGWNSCPWVSESAAAQAAEHWESQAVSAASLLLANQLQLRLKITESWSGLSCKRPQRSSGSNPLGPLPLDWDAWSPIQPFGLEMTNLDWK